MKRRVVVTGIGAITPIGNSVNEFWNNIKENKNGIEQITYFNTEDFKVKLAAEVKNFNVEDYIGKKDATFETCGVYHIIGDSIIELITPSSGEKTYYRMLNNKQVMLSNKEGDINKGSLAEHYILNKK